MKTRRHHFLAIHCRSVCLSAILAACAAWLSDPVFAQHSFTNFDDVQQVLAALIDALPPELKSSDLSARRRAWPDWVIQHDREIRSRLLRGDDDTIVNWLLLGTSFTQRPRALIDSSPMSADLRQLVAMRTRDLISALAAAAPDERKVFARGLLLNKGYSLDTAEERARLERHLHAEVDRVAAEQQQYTLTLNAALRAGNIDDLVTAESRLFRDRGLSLDTSILPAFAIEKALEAMMKQRLLTSTSIRRVAIIGPGLDFADKNSGYDFYPVQTLQPFTTIDSLARLGLARPDQIELTTMDISPRVNDHVVAIRQRARAGDGYVLRIPLDLGFPWTPDLLSYWKNLGNRIGSLSSPPKPPSIDNRLEVRGVEVRPQVVTTMTPVDFNVSTGKWTGPPFDLVIATNVLIYYDKFDQSLAFSAIETMLKPGGFFLTNNPVVELPASRLRSLGFVPVQYSSAEPLKFDHIFWYRKG